MSANVTSLLYPKTTRTAGLVAAGVGAVAIFALGTLDRLRDVSGWVAFFAAIASFVGLFVALEVQPGEVKLRDLGVPQRQRALTLAWGRVMFSDVSPWRWGGAAVIVAAGARAAAVHGFGDRGEARAALALLAALVPGGAAALRHWFYAEPFFEKLALRAAGVSFVNQHGLAWTERAARVVCDQTIARFRQEDPKKEANALWLPQEDSQITGDMPPRYTNFLCLAVGEFVGVRSGPFLDIKETAERHAAEPDPDLLADGNVATGTDSKLLVEREAHYADVVNIEYRRADATAAGDPAGIFELGLTNGAAIQFVTLEAGPPVEAALEHIRNRTRRAKAR